MHSRPTSDWIRRDSQGVTRMEESFIKLSGSKIALKQHTTAKAISFAYLLVDLVREVSESRKIASSS